MVNQGRKRAEARPRADSENHRIREPSNCTALPLFRAPESARRTDLPSCIDDTHRHKPARMQDPVRGSRSLAAMRADTAPLSHGSRIIVNPTASMLSESGLRNVCAASCARDYTVGCIREGRLPARWNLPFGHAFENCQHQRASQ
jgi:hypothetical protein